jgi:hypothetical protein
MSAKYRNKIPNALQVEMAKLDDWDLLEFAENADFDYDMGSCLGEICLMLWINGSALILIENKEYIEELKTERKKEKELTTEINKLIDKAIGDYYDFVAIFLMLVLCLYYYQVAQ